MVSAARFDDARARHGAARGLEEKDEEISRLRERLVRAEVELLGAHASRDAAARDRNACVALITRMADELGIHACLTRSESQGARHVVCVQLPAGQVSWPVPDEAVRRHFAHLMIEPCDQEDVDEAEKLRRLSYPMLGDRCATGADPAMGGDYSAAGVVEFGVRGSD